MHPDAPIQSAKWKLNETEHFAGRCEPLDGDGEMDAARDEVDRKRRLIDNHAPPFSSFSVD